MHIKRHIYVMLVIVRFHLAPVFFFFNDTATTEIYTLSLHDALPISRSACPYHPPWPPCSSGTRASSRDRKSTRLNSSHANISYAVFCLKKKTNKRQPLMAYRHI